MAIDIEVANKIGTIHIAELELHAEAWKKACKLFHAVERGEKDENDFFCDFHELMVIHGDPTKAMPIGTIDFKERPDANNP